MLALILGAIIIFFILVSFGDLSLKLSKNFFTLQTSYNLLDKYLLGLAFLLIPLQLWSIFFPSGVWFLFLALSLAIVYCFRKRKRCINNLEKIKREWLILKWWQKLTIALFVLAGFISCVWIDHSYDAEFYHYQNMLWIENYAVVPGLGNWEDRFGFNSNYFLFGAIFSFNKGLLEEPLFAFNISFFIPFFIWIVLKNFRSGFEAKYLALLIMASILLVLNATTITNSSTDFLPNVIAFYLLSSILLNKNACEKKVLLFFAIPVLLLTFKLSMASLGLFCIFIFYFCFKKKEYKGASFLFVWSLLAVGLWLTRNVILTGYLVYPIYQIDLFSFDWKMPRELAMMQANYIRELPIMGWKVFIENFQAMFFAPIYECIMFSVAFSVLMFALVSLLVVIVRHVLKKCLPASSECVFWVSGIFTLILGATSGFDLRFIFGVIFAFSVYGLVVVLSFPFKKFFSRFGMIWVLVFVFSYFVWSVRKFYSKYYLVYYWESRISALNPSCTAFLMPYPNYLLSDLIENLTKKGEMLVSSNLRERDLYGMTIYENEDVFSMFRFPMAITYLQSDGRFIDHKCIRLRGVSFQDGFRMDENCFEESTTKKYGTSQNNKWLKKE